jgi:hypothetical protein
MIWVFAGLWQPYVPLCDYIFTRTGEVTRKWAKLHPSMRNSTYHSHHPLDVCIRDNIYTWEVGAGLGWDAAASGSIIGPELS